MTNRANHHVLAVEVEDGLRELVHHALEREQLSRETAATGREALERLTARPWDLVLLDLGLPDLHGFDPPGSRLPGGVPRCPPAVRGA